MQLLVAQYVRVFQPILSQKEEHPQCLPIRLGTSV